MKKILLFVGMIPALCAGLLCACATTKTDIKQLEGKWTITAVNGEKIQTEEPPFLGEIVWQIKFSIVNLREKDYISET